ncbi:hypothetical protein PCANC_07380 [Puccinia coronata f. sp. avenae]|uniref:Uncharacterized protein n=1 Tax=Puccinia coronata f. sp. avenae TaxID=200324 RepID=A0A2N5T5D4_9BASI|nr:hypothetical protein PCANC_07380 [Puccinia coronata f. sp. avenae]
MFSIESAGHVGLTPLRKPLLKERNVNVFFKNVQAALGGTFPKSLPIPHPDGNQARKKTF